MPAAVTVHLVRHAEHIHQGRVLVGRMSGVPLSDSGERQADGLAERLSAERIDAVYASPSERAQATALPIAKALGLAVQTAPELDELDFGEWTGTPIADLDADPRWAIWNRERGTARAPGGESMGEAGGRLTAFVDSLREQHPGGVCVLVSHADVIRAGICHVLGLSLDRYDRFDVDTASLSTLVAWEGGAKLVRLNETLSEARALHTRPHPEVLGRRPSLEGGLGASWSSPSRPVEFILGPANGRTRGQAPQDEVIGVSTPAHAGLSP